MSDFYVGYAARASAETARFVRRVVCGLMGLAAGLSLTLVFAQAPFARSFFEFGVVREVRGVVRHVPYPVLERAGGTDLLVGEGKWGVDARVFDGREVRVVGTRIFREGRSGIEVRSIHAAGSGMAPLVSRGLGRVTWRGEIADSKCWLGVMNPGAGTVHRGCAVRCISGGIPPSFVARATGEAVLLTGARGEAVNRQVLDLVGVPLEIAGELVERGGVRVLAADPGTYRRVGR